MLNRYIKGALVTIKGRARIVSGGTGDELHAAGSVIESKVFRDDKGNPVVHLVGFNKPVEVRKLNVVYVGRF